MTVPPPTQTPARRPTLWSSVAAAALPAYILRNAVASDPSKSASSRCSPASSTTTSRPAAARTAAAVAPPAPEPTTHTSQWRFVWPSGVLVVTAGGGGDAGGPSGPG